MGSADLEHDHVEPAMHMSHSMPAKTGAGHVSHDQHAEHSVAMFRDKFWLTLILSLPVVVWSTEVQHWFAYTAPTFPDSQYIPAFLGTVVACLFVALGQSFDTFFRNDWNRARSNLARRLRLAVSADIRLAPALPRPCVDWLHR